MADGGSSKLTDRVAVVVALLTSFSGAAVSLFNAMVYWHDRDAQAHKETFDSQVTISRTYFDTFAKLPTAEFCGRKADALLYGRTALKLADLDEPEVVGEINSAATDGLRADEKHDGVESVAILMFSDIQQRIAADCPPQLDVKPSVDGKAPEAAPANAAGLTNYNLQQNAKPLSPAAPGIYTVWIQYAARTADLDRARQLQERLQAAGGYKAPGVQGVEAVPNSDQIRIFHASDYDAAKQLAARLGLNGVQIVSLEKAYPNLPTQVMEVWLKRSATASPGSGRPDNAT